MFRSIALFVIIGVVVAQSGQPLILSKYLNNPDQGQQAARVTSIGNYTSYSGFFTVNERYGSNMFFWFFPAQNGDQNAPILMWLQGGPGGSSMFGLFAEQGPFSVAADAKTLIGNPYTWNQKYSMLYVDNPVGVGFSFTNSDKGFSRNTHDEVASNLVTLLTQFFTIFYQYKTNDFYVTGESYAGKYVPSCAFRIHSYNSKVSPDKQINLKGIAIGDGIMDPLTQFTGFGDLLYHLGLADENQVEVIKEYEARMKQGISTNNHTLAFSAFDEMLNGDFWPYGTYFENITGNGNYFNFLDFNYPANPYDQFLNSSSVRAALHVGSVPYFDFNQTVERYLIQDWMSSIVYMMPTLMDNYKVMIYNGQVDIILGAPLCEKLLRNIPWSGLNAYKKTDRIIWRLNPGDTFPAGYVRQVQSFTQVIVREAGHLLPADQPARALDMITRFVDDIPFNK